MASVVSVESRVRDLAMVRMVAGFVLELVGVAAIVVAVGVNFGWSWSLVPVAVYLIAAGIRLSRGR